MNLWQRRIITGLVAVSAGIGLTMQAADSQRDTREGALVSTADRQMPAGNASAVRGTVSRVRRVQLFDRQGQPEQHTLVRVRFQNGNATVVDLGPKMDIYDLQIAPGDEVRFRGDYGTIDGRRVLMAEEISVNGRTSYVTWNTREPQSKLRSTFYGAIQSHEPVELEGQPSGHKLVQLRMKDGDSMVVDLGPDFGKKNLKLDDLKGDWVWIGGIPKQIGGHTVLMADEIHVSGKDIQLQSQDRLVREKTGPKAGQ